jgi:2Fe-2S ferredoxin
MPSIKFVTLLDGCKNVTIVNAESGKKIIDIALENNIKIEHACEMSCACASCHVHIVKGMDSLNPISDLEEDMLDNAWEVDETSRLSCNALLGSEDIEVNVPKYTLNLVSEE